jgi:hypothetical protein
MREPSKFRAWEGQPASSRPIAITIRSESLPPTFWGITNLCQHCPSHDGQPEEHKGGEQKKLILGHGDGCVRTIRPCQDL